MAAIVAVPVFIAEYLASVGASIEAATITAGMEIGLSEGAATAGTSAAKGAVLTEVSNKINDLATSIIGQENVEYVKERATEAFGDAQAILGQDPFHFLHKNDNTRQRHDTKKTINFNTDAVPASSSGHVIEQVSFSGGQQSVSTNVAIQNTTQARQSFTPRDVSDFIVAYASGISAQGIADGVINRRKALSDAIAVNPDKNMTLAKILGPRIFGQLPSNNLYKSIQAVYNGIGLAYSKNFDPIKKLLYFTMKDEVGSVKTMYQTTGITLPTIHGVFVGPMSANNADPVDLLDLYAMYHDESYINGPNQVGDYKFISRIVQNYTKMGPDERSAANVSILYFSTLGHAVSSIFGSNIVSSDSGLDNPTPAIPATPATAATPAIELSSIYTELVPNTQTNPIEINTAQTQYYSDIAKEINISSGQMMGPGSKFRNTLLLNAFDNILVELL